jgi:dTDP-glucose 4,6-dehydratase
MAETARRFQRAVVTGGAGFLGSHPCERLLAEGTEMASPTDYLKYPIDTLRVGSLGTLHALGLAAEKGAWFILASTSEVYGDPLRHPQAEDYWGNVNPVGPRGVHDEAKRFSETLTMAYRRSRELERVTAAAA